MVNLYFERLCTERAGEKRRLEGRGRQEQKQGETKTVRASVCGELLPFFVQFSPSIFSIEREADKGREEMDSIISKLPSGSVDIIGAYSAFRNPPVSAMKAPL